MSTAGAAGTGLLLGSGLGLGVGSAGKTWMLVIILADMLFSSSGVLWLGFFVL